MRNVSQKLIIEILKKSLLPFAAFILLFLIYLLYSLRLDVLLSQELNLFISKAFSTLFILLGAFWFHSVSHGIFAWYAQNIAAKTQTPLDEEFIPLFERLSKTAIWIIALIMVLSNFGININALIAALGVGSLAIALAAQDTIANIIAGFLIMVDRPFRMGDIIKLPSGEKVKVLSIGIRRSKFVLEEESAVVIVPNLELSKSKILNYSRHSI